MKLVVFLILSTSTFFVVQTTSFSSLDEESSTIGSVQNEESDSENKIENDDSDSEIENTLQYKFTETISLDDLWSENFETEYISLDIRRVHQQQIPEQVLEILRHPSKTVAGIKSESQYISTTDQYEKFRIKVQPSEKITLLDINNLKDSNDSSLKSATSTSNQLTTEFSNNVSEKEGLTEWSIYREYRTTMQPSKHEIHSRKDPTVAVFDEITQQIDFGSDKLADVIENNEFKPQAEIITSPYLEHQSKPIETINYTLPSVFNKTLIDGLQAPVDQTWQGADYQVRFKRNSPDGDVELWWKRGQDDIYLHAFPNGAADQNWGFGTVHLGLFRDEDGNLLQVWDFGNAKLEYIKDIKSPPPRRVWEFGNRDEASYWKYRHLIKLWCNANDFFIGEKSCIIY